MKSACKQIWDELREPVALKILVALLVLDGICVVLHLLAIAGWVSTSRFSFEIDRGYPEIYQYLKELWIVVHLFLVVRKTGILGYGVWALCFTYILADDALMFHEHGGRFLSKLLGLQPAFGLRPQDFGELTVVAGSAFLLIGLLSISYLRGKKSFRQVSRHLFLFLVLLGFFGVVVDMLHVALKLGWQVSVILSVIEDGGEMVVISLTVWYVMVLNRRNGKIGTRFLGAPD